jgi:hypothetical protein
MFFKKKYQPGKKHPVKCQYIPFGTYLAISAMILAGAIVSAQDITTGVDLEFAMQQGANMDGSMKGIKSIAVIVVNASLFVGLIPVVRGLAEGGERGKKLLGGWVIALLISQLAFAIV